MEAGGEDEASDASLPPTQVVEAVDVSLVETQVVDPQQLEEAARAEAKVASPSPSEGRVAVRGIENRLMCVNTVRYAT